MKPVVGSGSFRQFQCVTPLALTAEARRLKPVAIVIVLVALAATVGAQTSTRRATDIAALAAFPGFFHGQAVVLQVDLIETGNTLALVQEDEERALRVTSSGAVTARGRVEVRGVFWDVGRMMPDDPRVITNGIQAVADPSAEADWPKPGEVFVLFVTDAFPLAAASSSILREVVLDPGRHVEKPVTVVGQFRGRNLYADLPQAPGVSRWDFVLKSADAALWVTGTQPRGKGFDLNVNARIDTGRWLEVSGIVKRGGGLVWIESAKIAATAAPAALPVAETVQQTGPPPVVVFSTPTPAETDVPPDTRVRVQFSRDMDSQSFRDQVRVSYLAAPAIDQPEPASSTVAFTTSFDGATRALTIQFSEPLTRLRTVNVELLGGIKAFDGVALVPWTLSFTLGN